MASQLSKRLASLVSRADSGSGDNSQPESSSASAFLWTLIPSLIVGVAFVTLFLILRRKSNRVYGPRTFLNVIQESEKTPEQQSGLFNWVAPFRGLPDTFVLNHQSLDGYLFLRFLKMVVVICFVGCCITWPVLFPVNATGSGGQTELDLLSYSNAGTNNRYYAHALIAWVFLGFVMFVILRETIHFINLRHAYFLSPFQSSRISSRTVLFSDVPEQYIKEDGLKTFFGESVKNIWVVTDCKKLTEDVEKRDEAAMKLEGAEIQLSRDANNARLKAEKKNKGNKVTPPQQTPAGEESGQFKSPWLNEKDRPKHRLRFLIGKKVDTINWAREQLRELVPGVESIQAKHRAGDAVILPSVFVEFHTQLDAQFAFRQMRLEKPNKIEARQIGIVPSDVVWKNVGMKKTQRNLRMAGAITFITLMIIFWAIPVAVVGAISNINYLITVAPFLSFIEKIPAVVLGAVTGLLPVVLLAVLMALVPIICRLMAKLGGEPTLSGIELRTQNWYFAFQVIQVFLVTTLASGAVSAVGGIINDPSSATFLLATSLPKASNFYISFFILQGIAIASGGVLNIVGYIMFTVVAKFLDKTPRKIYNRWISLSGAGWGATFPKFTNLAVIAITYSCIAPLILGFATIGILLIYLAYRYNFFYVITNDIDTRGLAYAKALQQLMTGVYLAEVCLIGLFAIGSGSVAIGPLVLMIVFLVITALFHATMRHALKPLTQYLPRTLSLEDQLSLFSSVAPVHYSDPDTKKSKPIAAVSKAATGTSVKKDAVLAKIFNPQRFKSYKTVQTDIEQRELFVEYEDGEAREAYYNPAITTPTPQLWIVKDEMGISANEIKESEKVVRITDHGAIFNEKGKVVWDQEAIEDAPVYEKSIMF